jgi:hypothetical protein
MKKKTIKVEDIRDTVNGMLLRDDITDDVRVGMCAVLENILHITGNYQGFNNVEWINGGWQKWVADGQPGYPDKEKYAGNNTKRHYY